MHDRDTMDVGSVASLPDVKNAIKVPKMSIFFNILFIVI